MISQIQLEHFKETGIWYTGIKAFDSTIHQHCLTEFLNKEEGYKSQFLQTKFNSLFEGYSFMGQENSVNQYAADRLYTYVMSDYFDRRHHPVEFNPLFKSQKALIETIKDVEKQLISALVPELTTFYDQTIAHSLSANYYPPGDADSLRLTAHPDGSLFTVFPFGMDDEFQYETREGSWKTIEKTDEMVCFSGYLLECMIGIQALNHKVEKKGSQQARYSFAYFSVPAPQKSWMVHNEKITSEAYYARYLSLFE